MSEVFGIEILNRCHIFSLIVSFSPASTLCLVSVPVRDRIAGQWDSPLIPNLGRNRGLNGLSPYNAVDGLPEFESGLAVAAIVCWSLVPLDGAQTVRRPFVGVTTITRTETIPRNLRMHIVQIDLNANGIRFQADRAGWDHGNGSKHDARFPQRGACADCSECSLLSAVSIDKFGCHADWSCGFERQCLIPHSSLPSSRMQLLPTPRLFNIDQRIV